MNKDPEETQDAEHLRIVAEAVQWLELLQQPLDDAAAEKFEAWVRTSPQHLRSLLKQNALNDLLGLNRDHG